MIDSHLDPERLPPLAHGLARWSAEESAHLERCAECRLEWNLVRLAGTLGRASAERIDPVRTAATVARRLETVPVPWLAIPPGRTRWILGVAAAAVLAFAFLVPRGEQHSGAAPGGAEIAVLHELDGLTAAELEAVLETLPPAADEAVHVESALIDDLSAKDLERMLHSME